MTIIAERVVPSVTGLLIVGPLTVGCQFCGEIVSVESRHVCEGLKKWLDEKEGEEKDGESSIRDRGM